MARKEPTCTSIVAQALRVADDFKTVKQLVESTGLNCNQVSAALYHMRKYGAADCVEQANSLWWYLTPETEQRCRCVEERAPEMKPRKQRKCKCET